MITFNILLNNCEYPVTIHKEEILKNMLLEKGKLIEFIEMAIIELNKDNNDIVKVKLAELIEKIN